MTAENSKRHTIARGELEKINLEGCASCGAVYVSENNSVKLGVNPGWHILGSLRQGPVGGVDRVIRVRGRTWGKTLGKKLCSKCRK